MSKTELQNEIVKTTEELPEALVKEILDFAEFLLNKQSQIPAASLAADLTTMTKSEVSHLESEFENYKTLYPKINA
jgi:hypothetical protein